MTHKRLGLFAIFACICIVCGLSCQKNDPPAGVDQKISSVVLDASKRWYSQKVSEAMDGTLERVKLMSNGILQPDWDQAKYETLSTGEAVINIPAPGYKLQNDSVTFKRFFVLQDLDNTKQGIIVEVYSKQGIPKNISSRIYDQNIEGFTGVLLFYDINYRQFSSGIYRNGRKVRGASTIARSSSKSINQAMGLQRTSPTMLSGEGDECTYYFLVLTYSDGSTEWTYLGNSGCTPPSGGSPGSPNILPPPMGGGFTAPLNPPDPLKPVNPCNQADSLESATAFKNRMLELKDATTLTYEKMYLVGKYNQFNLIIGTAGTAGDINHDHGVFYEGIIHSHDSSPGIFSTFSGADIISFYNLVANNNASNDFYMAVTTSANTSYLLQISDPMKFRTWFNTHHVGFIAGYELLIKPTNSAADNEKYMLKFFKDNDLGVTISKGNSTFTNWTRLSLDSENNVVNDPC